LGEDTSDVDPLISHLYNFFDLTEALPQVADL